MSNSGGFTILPIVPLKNIEPLPEAGQTKTKLEKNKDFSAFLQEAVNKLDQTQLEADLATKALVTGEINDFHTPVIALEKASLALGLAVTVRNKVLDAYHEIMRMQI